MKKVAMLCALILVVVIVGGCASFPPYLKDPANISTLGGGVSKCFIDKPNTYGLGLMYALVKQGGEYSITAPGANQIEVVLQCGSDMITVTCDPTKKPDQNPCSNLVSWKKQ